MSEFLIYYVLELDEMGLYFAYFVLVDFV